jgi:thioesterase domain-containing protein
LLAVRLIARAEKELGHKIPLAAIFQAPTIEQLAARLRQGQCLPPESSLVAIQPQGAKPPLFLVHGIGGGMFWGYANLARHLGTDQPVYALKSRGIDGREEFERIEDMAAQYAADLCAFQPNGPYYLGGYCFGGTVAYEMARQLRAQGKPVALLALLNCAPPNSAYGQFRWTLRSLAMFFWNIGYWIVYALRLDPPSRRVFLGWKWQMARKKISALFTGEKTGLLEVDVGSIVDLNAYPYDIRKLWEAHVRALLNYHPKPYDGRNTLFRTRGYQYICSFDPLYGWGELARGGIDVHVVPGAHESILEEPHVAVLAKQLAECLQPTPAA